MIVIPSGKWITFEAACTKNEVAKIVKTTYKCVFSFKKPQSEINIESQNLPNASNGF